MTMATSASNDLLHGLQQNGADVDVGGDPVKPEAWLRRFGSVDQSTVPVLQEWLQFLGSSRRTGTAAGGEPLLLSRWFHPTTQNKPVLDQMASLAQDLADSGRAPLPAAFPLMVKDRVAFRTLRGVHVLDASRVVGVVSDLLNAGRAEELAVSNRAEQERLREQHATKQREPLLTLAKARANREQVPFDELPVPEFTGIRRAEPGLATLRTMIDWQFLFIAWQLRGKYPAILEQPVARELYDDANTLLDQIVADGSFQARGAFGFWPARSAGDGIVLEAGPAAGGSIGFPMLRQQTAKPEGHGQ